MRCNKCGNEKTLLLYSAVCNTCDPSKAASQFSTCVFDIQKAEGMGPSPYLFQKPIDIEPFPRPISLVFYLTLPEVV